MDISILTNRLLVNLYQQFEWLLETERFTEADRKQFQFAFEGETCLIRKA